MFEKILFATSASPTCDDAAKVAFELSKKNRSKLTVMHVFGIPTRAFSPFVKDLHTGKEEVISDEYTSQVIGEMRSTYAEFLADRPDVELTALVGEPGTEILRYARKQDANLIVMGAHTRGDEIGATRHRAVAGSTMQRVARTARCPVLIVSRPCITCWSYFSNIVVGIDFSKASDNAFMFALNVAKDIGCRLHVFHAMDLSGEGANPPDQAAVEAKLAEARARMEKRYVSKMGDFDNYLIEVWEGQPYVEILKYARENKADLIALAHHTREVDPEEALLGSTVEQVVLRSACPVLSVNQPDKVDVSPYGYRPEKETQEQQG